MSSRSSPHRLPVVLTGLLGLVLTAGAAAQGQGTADRPPDPASLFPRQAVVLPGPIPEAEAATDEPALARLPLPATVLEATRPDLSDLRLFDATGTEVPYLVDRGAGEERRFTVVRRVEPEVVDVRRHEERPDDGPPVFTESWTLELPAEMDREPTDEAGDGRNWELVIETRRRQFVRSARVETVPPPGNGGGPGETIAEGSLFRLSEPPREQLRLTLVGLGTAAAVDRLEVTLTGEGGTAPERGFLEPVFHLEHTRTLPDGEQVEVPLEIEARRSPPGRTVLELARPRGLVLTSLAFTTTTATLRRAVRVWDEGPGRRQGPLGRGVIFRVPGAADLEIPVLVPRGESLRVEIDDGDSPPLADVEITAGLERPALVFAPPAGGLEEEGLVLRFGGGRAHRPRYDLAALVPSLPATGDAARVGTLLHDLSRLRTARLGPVTDNPRWDPSPVLAFAHRPGAPLEAALYRHRRRLDAPSSPEGLLHLPLTLEDVARARPDLADLRITGGTDPEGETRQWAYLLEDAGRRRLAPLGTEPPETRAGVSTHRLTLPVTPAAPDRLRLDPAQPFFDRAYRLHGRAEDRGPRQLLASGRLTRRALDPRPLEIVLPGDRLVSLELEVTDGDDAPLDLTGGPGPRVEARFPLPDLYLPAPAGEYQLLLGNPEAGRPRYELEQVRAVVLAARSARLESGELEVNPAFSRGARLATAPGFQTVLLWLAVGLAVAVLAGLTLRLVRQEGEAGE